MKIYYITRRYLSLFFIISGLIFTSLVNINITHANSVNNIYNSSFHIILHKKSSVKNVTELSEVLVTCDVQYDRPHASYSNEGNLNTHLSIGCLAGDIPLTRPMLRIYITALSYHDTNGNLYMPEFFGINNITPLPGPTGTIASVDYPAYGYPSNKGYALFTDKCYNNVIATVGASGYVAVNIPDYLPSQVPFVITSNSNLINDPNCQS